MLFFGALATAAALAGGGGAIAACSSSSEDTATSMPAGGRDAALDAVIADGETRDLDAAPEVTAAECLAKCKTLHPSAVSKYDAIDTCWTQSCKGPCIDSSGMFDAGADAGEGGSGNANDGGTNLCGTPVASAVDRACDDCTEALCCPAWKGCYDDADCLDYNRCVNACP